MPRFVVVRITEEATVVEAESAEAAIIESQRPFTYYWEQVIDRAIRYAEPYDKSHEYADILGGFA